MYSVIQYISFFFLVPFFSNNTLPVQYEGRGDAKIYYINFINIWYFTLHPLQETPH